MACFLDTDESELMASGYARNTYPHSLPVAMLSLIQSFYTLWKKRRLTQDEMNKIHSLRDRQFMSISLHTIRIEHTPLTFYLRISKSIDYLRVGLCVNYNEESVDFIAGHFWAGLPSDERRHVPWKRTQSLFMELLCEHQIQKCVTISMSTFKTLDISSFDCYYECHQIAFSPKTQIPNFDVTPLLTNGGIFEWDMDCGQYDNDLDSFIHRTRPDSNAHWDFVFKYRSNRAMLQVIPSFLPLKVRKVIVNVTIKLQHDGFKSAQQFEDRITCCGPGRSNGQLEFEFDGEIIRKNSSISAEVAVDIVSATGHRGICNESWNRDFEQIGIKPWL